MAESVKALKYTVIAVRYSNKNQNSPAMNWWIEETPLSYSQERENSIKVSGIPAYVPKAAVLRLFTRCGLIRWSSQMLTDSSSDKVDEAEESHLPTFNLTLGGYCLYIQFTSQGGRNKSLNLKYDNNYTVCDDDYTPPTLSKVWCEELQAAYSLDTSKLKESCTEYMKTYDSRQQKREKEKKQSSEQADDEGWITVTRTKTNRPPKALKAHELRKLRKHKQNQTLLHFYKNQVADSKMQKIRELKAKFEEDKKRIQEMRQQRKFKPY